MEPWYKVAMPRKEVREGRSFNPDEFAIALNRWWLALLLKITVIQNSFSLEPALHEPFVSIQG
jgi:hypothetical protein